MSVKTALLIPCFNAVRFLPRLREQVNRLSPKFDEVLLADDCSTDNTIGVSRELGFQIVPLPKNLGPGGARNALARRTTAEWIHFHDVDDELAPDYLVRVNQRGNADFDIVFHFVDFIDEQTRKLIIRWEFEPDKLSADPQKVLLSSPMGTTSSFIRRSFFLETGGFDEGRRCFEDGDLHFRLAAKGARVCGVPEVLEWSLRHGDGAGDNQHYCFMCRLAFLEGYATSQPERLHSAIAEQAERAAVMLLRFGDKANAMRAVALAQRLGRSVPLTSNFLLRSLRHILPPTTLLHWQDGWRRKLQS